MQNVIDRADRFEHVRETEFGNIAEAIIKNAFQELKTVERWVKRNSDRLKRMPLLHKDRNRTWKRFFYDAFPRVCQVENDLVWFQSHDYEMWTYWLDIDAELYAKEYRRRAERLLSAVREFRREAA